MVNNNYQIPQYPKVKSQEGQKIVEAFVSYILNSTDKLINFKVGQTFFWNWQKEDKKPRIGIFGRRYAPKESSLPCQIGFFGSFPESVENVRSLLADAVKHKIAKSYTSYDKGRLMLLVYEVGSISIEMGGNDVIERAIKVLTQDRHPFDEVWYIFPYADGNIGALYKIWSK